MNASLDASSALEVRSLQYQYASALDRRDPEQLLAVFHDDATVRVFEPEADEPRSEIQGHSHLVHMVESLRQLYAATMHVVTNDRCQAEGGGATGQAYCVAHHLINDDGPPRTFVTYLIYDDVFGRFPAAGWRIVHRDIRMLWAEERPALSWESALIRGRLQRPPP